MKKLIIANWKCNPETFKESVKILESLKKALSTNNKTIICPPNIFLRELISQYGGDFLFGAQNCYSEQKGAYTGEISPNMLTNSGVKYVILGHSERRSIFKEGDKEINMKIKKVLEETKLIPILCIGENRGERENSQTHEVIYRQLNECLKGVSAEQAKKIIVAYEPLWAIGTGIHADEEQIVDAKIHISSILCDIYAKEIVSKINIIYGGSVNSNSIEMIVNKCLMDGVLVGGASLDPVEFSKISAC